MCDFNGSIYKTINSGHNWEKLLKGNAFLSSQRNHLTCMDARNNETIMAAGEEGYVLLSKDEGASWLRAQLPDKIRIHQIKLSGNSDGWVVTDKGGIYSFLIH